MNEEQKIIQKVLYGFLTRTYMVPKGHTVDPGEYVASALYTAFLAACAEDLPILGIFSTVSRSLETMSPQQGNNMAWKNIASIELGVFRHDVLLALRKGYDL